MRFTILTTKASFVGLVLAAFSPQGGRAQDPDSVLQIPPLEVAVLRSALAGARSPFAVAGLEGDDLTRGRPAAFLSEALRSLPGLQMQNRHNLAVGERLSVRGFGARAQFGVRGVKVLVDGIPATLPDGQSTLDHLDLASLGSAEILRGPGAALYGNAAGGVLLLSTRVRGTEGTRALLRTAVGSHGRVEASAQVEAGDADSGTIVSVSRFEFGGYRTNPLDGGTYGSAERWTLNARHTRALGSGELAMTVAGVDLDAENPGSLPRDSLGDPDRSAWGFNVRQRNGKTVRQGQLGIRWRGPAGAGSGDLSAWGLVRDVRNPIPTSVIGLERWAAGARAALRGGLAPGLNWDVGAEVEFQRDDRTNHENEGGDEGALTLAQDESVRGFGLHARLIGDWGPVTAHAALRHDRFLFEADDRRVTTDDPDDSGSRSLSAWSPSVGALVGHSERLRAFASVSSFFETPTTTELANRPDGAGGFNPGLEPTRGWTLEAGLRGRATASLGWELVAFRTELSDELVPFEVPDQPGRTFFRNAGRSRHEGWEAALRAALPGSVTARAAYTRVDARFRDGAGEERVGHRIPGRSPNRFEASLVAEQGPYYLGLDVTWNDAVPVDDGNSASAPAHTLLDVRVGADRVGVGRISLAPYLSFANLLDESYVGSVVVNAFGGRFYEPGPGRTLSLGLQVTTGGR